MKKHLNFINVGLIIFAIICLICPVLWLFEIELYFDILGGIISFDVFFFAIILLLGLLYLKFSINRMKKTGSIATLLIWTLPPVFAIISIFIIIETNSILLSVLPTTLILVFVLFSIKTKIRHILYATLSYFSLCITLVGPLLMSLFFLPALNTDYEIYKSDGITFVVSHETFLTQNWEVTYQMTSPFTMVEVE